MGGARKISRVKDGAGACPSLGDLGALPLVNTRVRQGTPVASEKTKKHKVVVADRPSSSSLGKTSTPASSGSKAAAVAKTAEKLPVGKSPLSRESIRLSPDMVGNILLGHGTLPLGLYPKEYDDFEVYSGDNSSGEISPRHERSYRIARALGAESAATIISSPNFVKTGILPSREGLELSEKVAASFSVPEVEMDLTQVPNNQLLDAVFSHASQVTSGF